MSVYSVDQIKSIVTPIAQQYGVERMMLFGSYARGDATESSDLDFHVACGEIKDGFTLSGFILDLQDALNKKVDVVTTGAQIWDDLDRRFFQRIEAEEVTVYG